MNEQTGITITPVVGWDALVRRYPGQCNLQDCYIELDTETGGVCAEYNPEIGTAVPMRNWHGIARRYSIPVMSADCANQLMDELRPLFERVVTGTTVEWNGSNHVGIINDDAWDAEEEIVEHIRLDTKHFGVDVRDACEWVGAVLDEALDKTDAELRAFADVIVAEAKADGIYLDGDVYEILIAYRDKPTEEEGGA